MQQLVIHLCHNIIEPINKTNHPEFPNNQLSFFY